MSRTLADRLLRAGQRLAVAAFLVVASGTATGAITYVGSTSAVVAANNIERITLAYPAGVTEDDILIAQIVVREDERITAPAGWTLIDRRDNGELTQALFWKRAGATNPTSATWDYGEDRRATGTLTAYRGVDPFFPLSAWSERSNASSTRATGDSVTPTVEGVQLVAAFAVAHGGASFTPPAGMSERRDAASGAGPNGVAAALADEAYAGGLAATGLRTAMASEAATSLVHLLALRPDIIASYRMDEAAWSGAVGQVADSSGRNYNATAASGATTALASPAIPGSPGTCGYGSFDGSNDYVAVPGAFPNLTTDFTLTAWIRTTDRSKSGQRIFIDDQNNSGGYGLSLGDGGAGRVRFYSRSVNPIILDTPDLIQNGTWYFVAAVAEISAGVKRLYVYNQAGVQIAAVSQSFSGSWGIDPGAASIGGENAASAESGPSFKFSGNLDEVSVFSGALKPSRLRAVMNQTRPCLVAPPLRPSGFNGFETATPAGSIDGVIRTKVAASAFGLDIVAVNSAATAVETRFTGDVKLELVDASTAASCGSYALIRPLNTLSFTATDQGRKTFTGISEANAWRNARIRMSYPATGTPTVVACSTDNFAIRPAGFGAVRVSDADSMGPGSARTLDNLVASGGVVHKAGRPFRIAATAHNASAAVTGNYSGAPAASLTGCELPASGCTLGALATGAWSSVSGSGAVTTLNATYSEVGAFRMKLVDASFAAVDAGDGSSPAEMTIESAEFGVGRFVPDHFDLVAANTPVFKTFNDTTCGTRSFTYVGQPFGYQTLPQATITAKNAAGDVTLNYAGALWKLAASGATQTYAALTGTLDTGLVGMPLASETGGGRGTLTANGADLIAFTRSLPVAPFSADINLSLSIRDSAESGLTGNGIIETATPAVFTDIVFDAGDQMRFGRLAVSNAHGSELLALPVAIETQHWTGAGFTRNTVDFCTRLAANQVALTTWRRNLDTCETSASLAGRFNAGRGNLRFSAPGQDNSGSVDLAVRLDGAGGGSGCVGGAATPALGADQSWLQGRWSGGAYDQNPTARASFGLHRGSRAQIYVRELY